MDKLKRGAWLILAALLLSAPVAWAQTTGRIMGSLKDAQGAVLPGATVTLTGPALQGAQTQVTDQDGAFRFLSVPPGRYRVKIELTGFKTIEQSDVQVGIDRTVDLVQTMSVAGLAETVNVTSVSPTVDTTSTAIGLNAFEAVAQSYPSNRNPTFRKPLHTVGSSILGGVC